jgi:hypothetical protein
MLFSIPVANMKAVMTRSPFSVRRERPLAAENARARRMVLA